MPMVRLIAPHLRAIYYAVQNGADVMNMSFNYTTDSPELAKAIRYANGKGVVMVASAGNDGQRTVTYPVGFFGVVDVASTDTMTFNRTSPIMARPRCGWQRQEKPWSPPIRGTPRLPPGGHHSARRWSRARLH